MNDNNYPITATIEIFLDDQWQAIAKLTPTDPTQGYQGQCTLEYLTDYAIEHSNLSDAKPFGLSCQYPVDFDHHQESHWPAFILDLLPSGFGRKQWLNYLDLKNGMTADWPLLLRGTAFPPGNLRIAEAAVCKDLSTLVPKAGGELITMRDHPGFSLDDVVNQNQFFIEYAYQHGIYAAGGSDVQGVAPKLLMNQDHLGSWHAEGALEDNQIKSHWLVKRARGQTRADHKVIKNEAAYMAIAHDLGLMVHGELLWNKDSLFIPRFDRSITSDNRVLRYGMESLCSIAGIADYGVPVSQDRLCQTLIQFSSNIEEDLIEYIKRDILNIVMGNKDNHARNSAVLKLADGSIRLSPLFDFAPMYLDPEGIARVCRWSGEAEIAGSPVWNIILERYSNSLANGKNDLVLFGKQIKQLPSLMKHHGVDEDIIQFCLKSIEHHSLQLMAL